MEPSETLQTKVCIKCGTGFGLDKYYKNKGYRDGLDAKCKNCKNIQLKDYKNKNPEKVLSAILRWHKAHPEKRKASSAKSCRKFYKNNKDSFWSYNLKRKFDLTKEDYYKLLSEQGGGCAICSANRDDVRSRKLNVDHDHVTGKVRGILCGSCNRALGLFKDNKYMLEKAVKYLSKFEV